MSSTLNYTQTGFCFKNGYFCSFVEKNLNTRQESSHAPVPRTVRSLMLAHGTVHRQEQTSNIKRSGACGSSFLSMVGTHIQPPKVRQDKIKGKEMNLVINVKKIK